MELKELLRDLKEAGIKQGDTLLVHSSLSSLGWVQGGSEVVIDALLDAAGAAGTVMVPTLTGSEELSANNPPTFDVNNTPCWTGAIPETFRKRTDAVRSLHPTHSVAAVGPNAHFLTKDHLDSPTPCGPDSPYIRLAELGGKVVFIGVDLSCCTLLHCAEELAGVDYHLQDKPALARIIDEHGNEERKYVILHKYGRERCFTAMEPIFTKAGIMKVVHSGDIKLRVLQAKPALETTLDLLKKNSRLLCRTEP